MLLLCRCRLTDDVQMEELRWLYPLYGTVSEVGAPAEGRMMQNVTVVDSTLFALSEHSLELVLPGVTPTSRGAVKPSEEGEEKDVDGKFSFSSFLKLLYSFVNAIHCQVSFIYRLLNTSFLLVSVLSSTLFLESNIEPYCEVE